MAGLLNEIIAIGGSTAFVDPMTRSDIANWMSATPDRAAWHVAESDSGKILGFQWIEPHSDLPPQACTIATFVQPGRTGLGIGSALFDATARAARGLGFKWINATIRTDNGSGIAYYQSRGFEDWNTIADAPVAPRVMKRFIL
ncbi:sortase-like acyltransferase [Puniceibacterium sp. IMCC21224]|nr:GNAT family N-acetyltransferase [Puniceibacterium sp. IMCC21224]KMK65284.1 sortase-like acyltransferase [Puniceibacterium sp. IMCC21224]